VDSSAVTALTRRLTSKRPQTFAVGYREAPYSELSWARQVSEVIGTDHHEVVIGKEEFFEALPRLIWHEDEPITWPSSVSLYFVSQLASRSVKVVLTGEGSDELFAGYGRYRYHALLQPWADLYGALPAGLRNGVRSWITATRLLTPGARRRLQHSFLGREGSLEALYLDSFYCAFSRSDQARMLVHANGRASSLYEPYLRRWEAETKASLLQRMLYTDQATYLVELLMKQDQMSMACSIESRVPFLDHPFVEFAARIPDRMKLRGSVGKYILKKAVADLLPREVVHRKKMGFPTPLSRWLQQPGAGEIGSTLRSADGLLAAYVNRSALDSLLANHEKGLQDGTDQIWRLLNLQLWGEIFLHGRLEPCREPFRARPAGVSAA
jgi:asparagine synthase (glutamine-hydrolysing)